MVVFLLYFKSFLIFWRTKVHLLAEIECFNFDLYRAVDADKMRLAVEVGHRDLSLHHALDLNLKVISLHLDLFQLTHTLVKSDFHELLGPLSIFLLLS